MARVGKASKLLGILITATLAAASALADDLHYVNMMVGERAVGLAGAYTAVSDNPDGLYYNPAGIVYSGAHNMAASMNAYTSSKTVYTKAFDGDDWVRQSSALKPNFFGMTQQVGDYWVGFSYAVPDSSVEIQNQDLAIENSPTLKRLIMNFDERTTVMMFGPSVAGTFGKNISAGLTLYYVQRDYSSINNQEIFTADPNYSQWENVYINATERGIRPVFGLMFEPTENTAVGLRVAQTFLISSERETQSSIKTIGTQDPNFPNDPNKIIPDPTIKVTTTDSDAEREMPLEATVGFAWFPSKTLLMTADLSYYSAAEGKDIYKKKEAVYNVAAGVEYYFSDSWAVRTGLYTNRANTPKVKSGGVNQSTHVDLYGGTLSLLWFSKGTSISAGLGYSTGKGEDQLFYDSTGIQDITSSTLSLFLSTSYSY